MYIKCLIACSVYERSIDASTLNIILKTIIIHILIKSTLSQKCLFTAQKSISYQKKNHTRGFKFCLCHYLFPTSV